MHPNQKVHDIKINITDKKKWKSTKVDSNGGKYHKNQRCAKVDKSGKIDWTSTQLEKIDKMDMIVKDTQVFEEKFNNLADLTSVLSGGNRWHANHCRPHLESS